MQGRGAERVRQRAERQRIGARDQHRGISERYVRLVRDFDGELAGFRQGKLELARAAFDDQLRRCAREASGFCQHPDRATRHARQRCGAGAVRQALTGVEVAPFALQK